MIKEFHGLDFRFHQEFQTFKLFQKISPHSYIDIHSSPTSK